MAENNGELRMSLMGHLQELRKRLLRCVIAVLVLAVASLVYSKQIFGILMRPVLNALPPSARSLIYTSGIEEINVLMKVGLYCGLFLTTPVILSQLWGFVSPGLYPKERKLASPFVLFGTLAFLTGALFCYFGVLPTAFQYLLNDERAVAISQRLDNARLREQEALRFARNGDLGRAGELARKSLDDLSSKGDGQVDVDATRTSLSSTELLERLAGLGRLVDAIQQSSGDTRPVVRQVLEQRTAAVDALATGDMAKASNSLDQAGRNLLGIYPAQAAQLSDLWKMEKGLSIGKVEYDASAWTRPMLTMREQLSLVLMLELAFGVIFELPLVMALLSLVGLVKASFLLKYQRHAVVVCLIVAAVITPTGDAVNLALMTVPMLMCYELGVLAAWFIERKRAKQATSAALTTTTSS
jgi:sec-independent protein translocase protein TatC